MMFRKHRASIALVSLLIISTISLVVVVAASDLSISGSWQIEHSNNSLDNYYMAEGCFEEAMTRLEDDLTFTGTTLVYDVNQSCEVTVSGSSPIVVNIEVANYDYEERFSAEVNYTSDGEINNFELLQWEETG